MTERFVQNADFRSGTDDFGFMAPTPRAWFRAGGVGGFGGGAKVAEVKVVQETDVAGFHATTLWSTDAHAINDWMNAHGYVPTPEVERWADRNTKRGWYLTAFKVVDKAKLAASTGTVHMTFKTERPFNPFMCRGATSLAKQVKIPSEAIPDNVQVETFVDNDSPRPRRHRLHEKAGRPRARSEADGPDHPAEDCSRRRPRATRSRSRVFPSSRNG